jgi:hypothetical protein
VVGVAATVDGVPTVRPATAAVVALIARVATVGIARMMDAFRVGAYGARVTVPAPKATRPPATASSSESVKVLIIFISLVATLRRDDPKSNPHNISDLRQSGGPDQPRIL